MTALVHSWSSISQCNDRRFVWIYDSGIWPFHSKNDKKKKHTSRGEESCNSWLTNAKRVLLQDQQASRLRETEAT